MSQSQFVIPEEYKNKIHCVEPKDQRSEAEIIKSLNTKIPVTSEKNVWAYWHSGFDTMPGWCQRNVIDWVRILGPSWTVRVLNSIQSSPNYALNFVSSDMLPETFVQQTMDGPYIGPHSSDFLRGACLYTHGGVYMDVGCILFQSLDKLCWNELEDPNTPYQVSIPWMYETTTANHFVASRKDDPFIKHWHDLFVYLWSNKTNYSGISASPLLSFVHDMPMPDTMTDPRASRFQWDFKIDPITIFEYIAQVIAWQRVCMLEGTSDSTNDRDDHFDGVSYWQNHVLLFDVLREDWHAEEILGFVGTGQRLFDLLRTPLDTDPNSQRYREAHDVVWRMLSNSSMQKITHGKGLTTSVQLGVLWDTPGDEEADCAKGTFAELLRYGCTHFVQDRDNEYFVPPRPKVTLKKGLLEP